MQGLFDNASKIIHEAAQNLFGIAALIILVLSVIGVIFFRRANYRLKTWVFTLMFVGLLCFGYSIVIAYRQQLSLHGDDEVKKASTGPSGSLSGNSINTNAKTPENPVVPPKTSPPNQTPTPIPEKAVESLEQARLKQNLGLYSEAYRLYLGVYEGLPEELRKKVNRSLKDTAKENYTKGNFKEAAEQFEKAFENFPQR